MKFAGSRSGDIEVSVIWDFVTYARAFETARWTYFEGTKVRCSLDIPLAEYKTTTLYRNIIKWHSET